jgi:hypothetical protein
MNEQSTIKQNFSKVKLQELLDSNIEPSDFKKLTVQTDSISVNPRHIDLNDEVLQTLFELLGMHYFVKYQLLSRMWYGRITSFFSNFSAPLE